MSSRDRCAVRRRAHSASRALPASVRRRGTSSRASCWVSVDAPLTTLPRLHVARRRARHGERVDAGVPLEAPVLGGDERVAQRLRHRHLRRQRGAPGSPPGRNLPESSPSRSSTRTLSVPSGSSSPAGSGQATERRTPAATPAGRRTTRRRLGDPEAMTGGTGAGQRPATLPSSRTWKVPPSERPKTSGAYIASARLGTRR